MERERTSGVTKVEVEITWRSVLAVTLGGLIVIPQLVAYVHTIGRLQNAERVATGERKAAGGLITLWVGTTLVSIATGVAGYPLVCACSRWPPAWPRWPSRRPGVLNRVWHDAGLTGAGTFTADHIALG